MELLEKIRLYNYILVVGSNPSVKSPGLTPFHPHTRSSKVLHQWFLGVHVKIVYINVVDYVTPKNRPLTVREIRENLPNFTKKLDQYKDRKIVALGKTAAKALSMTGRDFFEAPHPSGLNRKLNDQEYVKQMKENLRRYCETKQEQEDG